MRAKMDMDTWTACATGNLPLTTCRRRRVHVVDSNCTGRRAVVAYPTSAGDWFDHVVKVCPLITRRPASGMDCLLSDPTHDIACPVVNTANRRRATEAGRVRTGRPGSIVERLYLIESCVAVT